MFSLCHFCGQIKGDIMDWVLINPSQTVFCCNDCINKTHLTINPSPVIPPTNPYPVPDIQTLHVM